MKFNYSSSDLLLGSLLWICIFNAAHSEHIGPVPPPIHDQQPLTPLRDELGGGRYGPGTGGEDWWSGEFGIEDCGLLDKDKGLEEGGQEEIFGSGLRDNGYTKKIQWDKSTLYIDGQPIFLYSGEFHYWRIPVPSLYLDIFQKLRATGYNAISIYFHWGFHNPAPGVWDFETGAHNIQPIFDAAKQAGLWVIARPGPYIHAETSAGGLPGWLVQLPNIEVRTNGSEYTRYWQEYIAKIGPIIAKNQIGKEKEKGGTGTVILAQIENEYYYGGGFEYIGADEYMTMISQAYRSVGIYVPTFHNDVGMEHAWLPRDYPGVMDLYGMDGYPRGFDCGDPLGNFRIVTNYYDYFEEWYPNGPQFTPEFQGGAFDPWGGPGYEKCAEMVGTSFVNVYYKNNVAQGFTMMSFYMAFGGTNWGYLLTPVVYSSYDYGAGIAETRLLRDKINEGKLLALFLRSRDDILHANLIGNSSFPSNGVPYSSNPAVHITELYNSQSQARFYIIRHTDTNSLSPQRHDILFNTTHGERLLTDLHLRARDSKILITDYKAGNTLLVHATSELLTWQTIDGIDTVFYVLDVDGQGTQEICVRLPQRRGGGRLRITSEGDVGVTYSQDGDLLTLSITPLVPQAAQNPDIVSIYVEETLRIHLLSKPYVYKFWAPVIWSGPRKVSHNDQILVHGPYLVRNATVTNHGSTLNLYGDTIEPTNMILWVTEKIKELTWNGEPVPILKGPLFARHARLKGPDRDAVKIPDLRKLEWMMMDSLPEIHESFDDSKWAVAREYSTNEWFPPETLPCLYAGEYGFHTGTIIYRGRFFTAQPTGTPTGVHLEIWGGTAFGYTAFLNGEYFTSRPGDAGSERFVDDWEFPPNILHTDGRPNILVIVADSNGYDRDNGVTYFDGHTTKKPRGIKSARLLGPEGLVFESWRLQGNVGGEYQDDKVRAPYNEDGLYFQRIGAHFPNFTAPHPHFFIPSSPFIGFPTSKPTIRFYLTTLPIILPPGHDVPLSIIMRIPPHINTRVLLFVNGYQMGRYVPHIGPQYEFPIFPGIINNGTNTLGVAIWGMQPTESEEEWFRFEELYVKVVQVLRGGVGDVDGVRDGIVTGFPEGRGKAGDGEWMDNVKDVKEDGRIRWGKGEDGSPYHVVLDPPQMG